MRPSAQSMLCAVLTSCCLTMASCSAQDSETAGTGDADTRAHSIATTDKAVSDQTASAPTLQSDLAKHDPAAFLPANARILDKQQGDLDGQGGKGILLILDPASKGNEKLGEGDPRTVLLLTSDESGALQKAAENARIVPCARCGGTAGDPFGFARIDKGSFTIAISGGSRERWSDEFTFHFDPASKTWLLEKASREVIDNATQEHEHLGLTRADFGDIPFSEFDPDALPKAQLK